MRTAREKISLAKIGIEGPLKVRKGLTGAFILEVGGADTPAIADRLAARLRDLVTEKGDETRIQTPQKIAAIRMRDLDESLSAGEMATVIASLGGCNPTAVVVEKFSDSPGAP